jgi:hypothetical protein
MPILGSSLEIASVALTVTGSQQTILARWSDSNLGAQQSFFFSDGVNILNQGITSSPTGVFAEQYTGPAGAPIYFTVSNSLGESGTQRAA